MSTRSLITVMDEYGFRSIYCHSDGYPEGVGKCLVTNYDTFDKATALIHLGDISSLHDTLEDTALNSYRERGEDSLAIRDINKDNIAVNFDKSDGEYWYLLEEGVWWMRPSNGRYGNWRRSKVASSNGWWRVTDVLASLDEIEASHPRRPFKAWRAERNHGREAGNGAIHS